MVKTNPCKTHFTNTYGTIDETLKKEIQSGNHILDLGSNSGTIASVVDKYHKDCLVHCVDIDQEALENIEDLGLISTRIIPYNIDANDFLNSSRLSDLDAITINATLHEINDPSNQIGYIKKFFELCKTKIKQDGLIIIGDYYYPDHVSDENVSEYMKQQIKEINHADPREKFVKPSLIWKVALESGLYVAKQIEIPVVKGIDRRYYNLIIRGETNGN